MSGPTIWYSRFYSKYIYIYYFCEFEVIPMAKEEYCFRASIYLCIFKFVPASKYRSGGSGQLSLGLQLEIFL